MNETVFHAFCDSTKKGSTTATDKTIKKMCQDAKLKLDQNSVDIELRKCLGNTKKCLTKAECDQFVEKYLAPLYAKTHKCDAASAHEKVLLAINENGPKAHGTTQVCKTGGVERMTDTSLYTASHKERFDSEGKGKGIEGRADTVKNTGYVGNYKGDGTYDKKK